MVKNTEVSADLYMLKPRTVHSHKVTGRGIALIQPTLQFNVRLLVQSPIHYLNDFTGIDYDCLATQSIGVAIQTPLKHFQGALCTRPKLAIYGEGNVSRQQ